MRDDAPDIPPDAPTIADIHDAATRLRGRAVRTPLLESDLLNDAPGRLSLPIMARRCGPGIAVSDAAALQAIAEALARLRIVLAPGGAVALAAALTRADLAEGCDPAAPVIGVASGGNVDAALFSAALSTA